jgi:hypothetical protein
LAGALRALQGRKRSSETTSCSPTSTDISLLCRAPPPDASSTSSPETCGRHPEWPRPALVQLGLSVVSTHRKKSRQTAWLMPRTRLGWDSLSHLRAGWSVASGRLNGVPSGRCRGHQWQELSGAQLPRAAAAIQLMPPCRLLLCRTARDEEVHGGDPAEPAGDGMGLPVNGCHPPDGDRPERRRYSPVPGLPAVRPLSRPQQLHGEACSCRWWAKRGRFTAPAERQQRTPPIADYPLAGITLQSGPPLPGNPPHCCSSPWLGRARQRA